MVLEKERKKPDQWTRNRSTHVSQALTKEERLFNGGSTVFQQTALEQWPTTTHTHIRTPLKDSKHILDSFHKKIS